MENEDRHGLTVTFHDGPVEFSDTAIHIGDVQPDLATPRDNEA
jgi:hypothetical protein